MDLTIGLVVLSLIIGLFTAFTLEMDNAIGQNTYLTSDLSDIRNTTTNVTENVRISSEQVDNLTSLTVDENQELETRASSQAGVANLFSKNIVTNFFKKASEKLHVSGLVLAAATSLLGLIVTLLVTRFFFGEGRV
jgi:predicted RND superfamily exporter protein